MLPSSKYQDLLEILLSSGLKPSLDWNNKATPSTLLLRHDVDFSIEYAHKLAILENDFNVKSSFFFMLSSNMYNLFSRRNRELVKEIKAMGHLVSLHFDPASYNNLDSFIIEKNAFESLIESEIDIISIHRPGPFLQENNRKLGDINQTYCDAYSKEMKYLSDSGGRDIFPLVNEYLKDTGNKGLHLLIHPLWWVGKAETPTEILNEWKLKNNFFITSEIRANCKTYLD